MNCPHCGKEINVPQNCRDFFCMYCAKPISIKSDSKSRMEYNTEEIERLTEKIKSSIPDKLVSKIYDMGKFNLKTYSIEFQEYYRKIDPIMRLVQTGFEMDSKFTETFAKILVNAVENQLPINGVKFEQSKEMFEYQYFMVVFLIPAILEFPFNCAEKTADNFIEIWNKNHPKCKIGKSTKTDIENGFKKKFCFVTTAVCEAFHKPSDCQELNVFRRFRDEFICKSEENRQKVLYYYAIAPIIVKRINMLKDSNEIYKRLYDEFLTPCLVMIENGQTQRCAIYYEYITIKLFNLFI